MRCSTLKAHDVFRLIRNIGVMFVLDAFQSALALVLLFALFAFVWWRHPPTDWGDISQALMYHQVRKYLLKIDETKSHTKFWRPSVLLFVDDYSATQIKGMVNFCREIKKGGLMVLGSVIVGDGKKDISLLWTILFLVLMDL